MASTLLDLAIAHPIAAVLLTTLLYALSMCAFRCCFERRRSSPAPAAKGWSAHEADVAAVAASFRSFLHTRRAGETVSLARSSGLHADSNRTVAAAYKQQTTRVDVSALTRAIALETRSDGVTLVHVEPGMPQDALARFCISHGVIPPIILEFPGISVGGALAGGGIESSSHAVGSFADTVIECDVIGGDGTLYTSVSRSHHPLLFAALRTTYGSVGLVTRVAVRVERAAPFVHVRYLHAPSPRAACAVMEAAASLRSPPNFIDGVAMSATSAMVVLGTAVHVAPADTPTVTFRTHRSDPWFAWHLSGLAARFPPTPTAHGKPLIAPCFEEIMPLESYLFRFDRGAFWMARPGLEWFFGSAATAPGGPTILIRLFYAWLATTRSLYRMLHKLGDASVARLFVVQDFVMPSASAASDFIESTTSRAPIAIWPLWLCPVRAMAPPSSGDSGFGFPIKRGTSGQIWFNVGVYGVPGGGRAGVQLFDPVELNVALEQAAVSRGGRKMLYAQTFDDSRAFWAQFDVREYEAARNAYAAAQSPGGSPFVRIDQKVLLGPARVKALRGHVRVPLLGWDVVSKTLSWFAQAWVELLLPRAVHSFFGLEHVDHMEAWAVGNFDEAAAREACAARTNAAPASLSQRSRSTTRGVRASSRARGTGAATA